MTNGLARKIGRENRATTDWVDWLDGPTEGPTEGEWDFACEEVDSAIALAETHYSDFHRFMMEVLPRLLWPASEALNSSVVLWRFHDQNFLKPWLDLLGIQRKFITLKPHVAIKFSKLYVPLWTGLSNEFSKGSDLAGFTPTSDVQILRQTALGAISHNLQDSSLVPNAIDVLILERSGVRRSFSGADTARLRRLARRHFWQIGMKISSVRGTGGGFESMPLEGRTFQPLTLAQGLHLFANAKVLIGMHGALLGFMIFSPPGGHVIEFNSPNSIEMYFYHYAATVGLNYWTFPVSGSHNDQIMGLNLKRLGKLLALVVQQLTGQNEQNEKTVNSHLSCSEIDSADIDRAERAE
eukprot:gnl/TRDRNA2_/TRDRNA2_129845_c0_seq1.p1 gnl/TRDRNA2_/TRDRNA2_129845_c0~~gnl/TRDRNA2_/TRDRNA2_129845_c0_seq1.p1  ORF type:complete len:353 (-),score=27.21 gnl/TRDRNA2_/TRDRNA2_129845_c0_seq1:50-1108(-)